MRKLYHEYFYIPKGGKIREKVMLARVVTAVLIVVLCLAAMGFTAYAYFSDSLTSGPSTLTAAKFDIEVSVSGEGRPVDASAPKVELKAGMTYEVMLRRTTDSTSQTGYVVIKCDDTQYCTTQLTKGETEQITFSIKPDADTTVTFLACLGTSSFYPEYVECVNANEVYENPLFIVGGEVIDLTANADAEATGEPAVGTEDEKEPLREASMPSAPAESVTSEPVSPAGSTEGSVSEPSEPTESTATEPTEPEVSEPVASTDPMEPETSSAEPEPEPTDPAGPETSGDASIEQSEPETEPSEETDVPVDEPIDESVDEPAEWSSEE